jgi:hypothetical protein
VAMRHWRRSELFNFPYKLSKKGHFGEILGAFWIVL